MKQTVALASLSLAGVQAGNWAPAARRQEAQPTLASIALLDFDDSSPRPTEAPVWPFNLNKRGAKDNTCAYVNGNTASALGCRPQLIAWSTASSPLSVAVRMSRPTNVPFPRLALIIPNRPVILPLTRTTYTVLKPHILPVSSTPTPATTMEASQATHSGTVPPTLGALTRCIIYP